MSTLPPSRREFLRQALGMAVVASTSPLVVLGRITPSITTSASGQVIATYTINLSDYPDLATVWGSVKLTQPEQLLMNPDHRRRSFTGKDFPIAITRVEESGPDAFKAVSTYCTHGEDYQVGNFNPVTLEFVCPHKKSAFRADGTHVWKPNTPEVGNLRTFPCVYDEVAGTITLDKVLSADEIEPAGNPPAALFLDQNYPNPFNPSTMIRYGIPERTHVRLTLHGTDGAAVETLVDETQEGGVYVVSYSAGTLASGNYFYRIETDRGTQVRRMTLVK